MAPVLVALLLASPPSGETSYTLDAARSLVRYHVVHKLHRVAGVSSAIEGRGLVLPDGRVQAMVRVPMASFDSGERNRDAHMRETVEAGRFPFVVFKGAARIDPAQLAGGREATVDVRMDGEVELHGVTRPVAVPLAVIFSPDGTARVRGTFEVSLETFGIERPSLLFVKVEDACRIEVDLLLRSAAP